MKRSVSDRARHPATELKGLFAHDAELVEQLDDAHGRLRDANERLWSGLHPDGLRAVYGDHPASEAARLQAAVHGRSRVLDSPDVLSAVQAVHWQIHQAHRDHQQVAEDRRHLAAEIGEVVRTFLDELIAGDWSEEEARTTNVEEFAGSPQSRGLGKHDSKLASGITSRAGAAGQETTNGQDMEPAS
ncbi:MAG: hypothetical protein ACLP50_08165 [Solirubrobacteraceae bacterium]